MDKEHPPQEGEQADQGTPLPKHPGQWPVPDQVPRTVLTTGYWKVTTGYSRWLPAVAVLSALAGAVMVAVPLETGNWVGLLCPLMTTLPFGGLFLMELLEIHKARQLLKYGKVVPGQVLQPAYRAFNDAPVQWAVTYEYDHPMGRQRRRVLVAQAGCPKLYELNREDPLTVIVDPREADRAVAPGLHGIEFEAVEDHRPTHLERLSTQDPGALHLDVLLDDGTRVKSNGEGLWQEGRQGAQLARVSWDKPLVVQSSAWLLDGKRAQLNVSVRQQGDHLSGAVNFGAILPQAQVSAGVPLKQETYGQWPQDAPSRGALGQLHRTLDWHGRLCDGSPLGFDPLLETAQRVSKVKPSQDRFKPGGALWVALALVQCALALGSWYLLDWTDPMRRGERLCAQGEGQGCEELATLYEEGDGVARNQEASIDYRKQGCELGYGPSCLGLGELYHKGERVAQNDRLALRFYRQACAQDSSHGCFFVGWLSEKGRGAVRDYLRAVRAYERACALGSVSGCYNQAVIVSVGKGRVTQDLEAGAAIYDKACHEGKHLGSCRNLGVAYLEGWGVVRESAKARELFEYACLRGDQMACVDLSGLNARGVGGSQDTTRALKLAREACHQSLASGCSKLGDFYFEGLGVEANEARALEFYTRACELGEPFGCVREGWMHEHARGTERDVHRAAALYRLNCQDKGDAQACGYLGAMHHFGRGMTRNTTQAAEHYQRACEGSIAFACRNLGVLYGAGDGVPQDKGQALRLLEKACGLGQQDGCADLALIYELGQSVPVDLTRAHKLYEEGCDAGHWRACNRLGRLHEMGKGVDVSGAKAADHYRRACENEHWSGCVSLGRLYEAGNGVKKSLGEALVLYRTACEGDDAPGCLSLGQTLSSQGQADAAQWAYERACELDLHAGCLAAQRETPQ